MAFIQMSDVDAGVAFYLSQLCSKDEEVPMRFDWDDDDDDDSTQ